jgi:hypothetical protein
MGDNSKRTNDEYLPFFRREFENFQNTGPGGKRLSKTHVIGQKETWIALLVGEEDLCDSLQLVRLERDLLLR